MPFNQDRSNEFRTILKAQHARQVFRIFFKFSK